MKYIYKDELYHHGIKGQRWGIRRYQNLDGSYTDAGLKRRNKLDRKIEKYETKSANARFNFTKRYYDQKLNEVKGTPTKEAFNAAYNSNERINKNLSKAMKLNDRRNNTTNLKKQDSYTKKISKLSKKIEDDYEVITTSSMAIKREIADQGRDFVVKSLFSSAKERATDTYYDGVLYVSGINKKRLEKGLNYASKLLSTAEAWASIEKDNEERRKKYGG